jgi:hypothetical protein
MWGIYKFKSCTTFIKTYTVVVVVVVVVAAAAAAAAACMGGCEYPWIQVESSKVRATLKQNSNLSFEKLETKLEVVISLT